MTNAGFAAMNLAEFARWAIENGPFDGCDLDGACVQEKAEACGILVKVVYDPEKHGGNHVGAAKGDDWYLFSPEFTEAECRPVEPKREGA